MQDQLKIEEAASATLVRRGDVVEGMEVVGHYRLECVGPDGEVKWVEEFDNLVTTLGKNLILDTFLAGSAYTASLKFGLKGAGSAAAGDTMASHAGWSEITAYSGNRPTPAFSAASGGSKATSAASAFSITGPATVAGLILISGGTTTPGNTTGTLVSAGDFAASRGVDNGDTLNASYSLAL